MALEIIYTVLALIGVIIIIPILLLYKRGRKGLIDRFGFWSFRRDIRKVVWIHGASVGEIAAVKIFIDEIRHRYPDKKVLVTSCSSSGLDSLNNQDVFKYTAPFDLPFLCRMVVQNIKPIMYILVENDIWPAMMRVLHEKDVPIYVINGRMTAKTFKTWRTLNFLGLSGYIFRNFTKVCATNRAQAERFVKLGVLQDRVVVIGTTKCDIDIPTITEAERERLRKKYNIKGDKVLVLGSIRRMEENYWFPAIQKVIKDIGDKQLSVVCAPRHMEDVSYFEKHLREYSLYPVKRTELSKDSTISISSNNVLLLDTLGELNEIYRIADLAFVGGTMIDRIGGHNPLEPISCGVPICSGHFCENIVDIIEELIEERGVLLVVNSNQIGEILAKIVNGDRDIREMSERALGWLLRNQGNTDRLIVELFDSDQKVVGSAGAE